MNHSGGAGHLDARAPERLVIDGIPVEVRRSRRRRTRLGLAFDPGGFVIVEAPVDASAREIRAVICEHRRWLRNRLDKVTNAVGLSACLRYSSGELIHYLGHPYELVVRPGLKDDVHLRDRRRAPAAQLALFGQCHVRGQICVTVDMTGSSYPLGSGSEHLAKAVIMEWYRRRAGEAFTLELAWWRRRLPWLKGRSLEWRHRFMRSQWGSCSRAGRISLNTHLVKTPPRLAAYVTLHELCHLVHYDHSRRFYGLMDRHMPDWQDRRAELDNYLPVLLQE